MTIDSPWQEMPNNSEDLKNRNLGARFALQKIGSKKGLLVLLIILMVAGSIAIYLSDIDWEEEIRRYGFFGVFLLTMVSSMSILFPLPGEAVLAAAPAIMNLAGMEVCWLGVGAGIGGSLGEITAYFAGLWGRVVISEKYQRDYGRVERWMEKYGGPAIFIFALAPLPFDLVGIAAGSRRFKLWRFLIFCLAGRLVRSLIIVYLGWGSFNTIFR